MEKTFYLNSSFEAKKLAKTSKGLKIAGYANTTDKDRVGDVVTAQAWAKGVDNYRKNPVLLYQHKHDQPIGKVDKVTVDKKGIYVEGNVSDAAEKLHGVQTLIKDGALKSFSVGFRVKDGKYDPHSDSMTITDVELLEISVVSVPANQNSLFSIRKSFEADDEYDNFVKNFKESEEEMETEDTILEEKSDEAISETDVEAVEEITETIEVEEKATEETSEESVTEEKSAEPVLEMSQDEEEEEDFEEIDPMAPIPFVNLLSAETSSLDTETFVKYEGKRFKITKIATAESPNFKFLEVDVNGKTVDNIVTVKAEDIAVVNSWDIGTKYDIHMVNTAISTLTDSVRQEIKTHYMETNTGTEQSLFNLKSDERVVSSFDFQEKLNKLLNLKSNGDDWSDSDYVFANYLNVMVNELSQMKENDHRDLALKLHGHEINTVEKENNDMATQTAGDVLTIDTGATENKQAEAKAAPVEVSEPRVAELIEKTGQAILAETDAQDKQTIVHETHSTAYTPRETEAVAELKAQMEKYREEIAALQNSKMVWQESQRNSDRWSAADQAKAVMLAHALGKSNPMDTKFGARMKADVTTVDQFLSNFSSNIYEEMQQQLVIAPMFERIAVDAKTFRVPVADEDTTDDVAQFANGTYASGIGDTTNVPTSGRNNQIKAVEFTPHKFMATTHIAKDEEEDTILPVIDFLRAGATRRLARSIDKSILRGTGALTGFTANSVAAISGGAGFASVITGVVELANAVGASALNVQTGGNSTKASPANIASARALLGKYGLQLGDQLVYLTTVEGYNSLVAESDFRTVDKFGPNATYLTGSLGAIYGIPVVITEFLDNVGGADFDIGALVYKPGFMIAERRGMEIESEYEPRQQVTAMYMSTRFDFKALTTNSSAALDATKYPYAAVVRSGS